MKVCVIRKDERARRIQERRVLELDSGKFTWGQSQERKRYSEKKRRVEKDGRSKRGKKKERKKKSCDKQGKRGSVLAKKYRNEAKRQKGDRKRANGSREGK